MQAGRNQHEHIMESLQLFAKEVMPEFKDRDAAHVAKKQQRLAPVIEAAMKRKVESAPKLPEGYEITPMLRTMVEQRPGGKEMIERIAQSQATGSMPGVMESIAQRQRGAGK
jgi:hypothetical protein